MLLIVYLGLFIDIALNFIKCLKGKFFGLEIFSRV